MGPHMLHAYSIKLIIPISQNSGLGFSAKTVAIPAKNECARNTEHNRELEENPI